MIKKPTLTEEREDLSLSVRPSVQKDHHQIRSAVLYLWLPSRLCLENGAAVCAEAEESFFLGEEIQSMSAAAAGAVASGAVA